MNTKPRKKPGPAPWKQKDPIRTIRVPQHEWESWRKTAKDKGLSIAKWLRGLANRQAKKDARNTS